MTDLPLTESERYRFDLQGFLVRQGVLVADEVAALHAAIDALDLAPAGDSIQSQRFSDHLGTSASFRALMDHAAVFAIVRELCGGHIRLDHAYGIVMAQGTAGLGLHGGGTPFDPAQYYVVRSGAIHTGLVAVQWSLVDHPAGSGGFCCVPGSHKAAFTPPADIADLAVDVPLAAGDVVVFTEALRHGTSAWRAPYERRTLLYKYSPGSSSWASQHGWPDDLVSACTDRQRLLLQPPSVAYHRPVV
jgi:ectoine hydroxylase-related dioxygenase (phytanoyl-CoA dioxygenase family)